VHRTHLWPQKYSSSLAVMAKEDRPPALTALRGVRASIGTWVGHVTRDSGPMLDWGRPSWPYRPSPQVHMKVGQLPRWAPTRSATPSAFAQSIDELT
jgi:hypothetical protein